VFSLKGKEIEVVSGNTAMQQYMMKCSKKINSLLIWNEFSDDSDMFVKYLSSSKQFYTSDDKGNVNDTGDMQSGTCSKAGAEQFDIPSSGKPILYNFHFYIM
jgi:hypothetical protein